MYNKTIYHYEVAWSLLGGVGGSGDWNGDAEVLTTLSAVRRCQGSQILLIKSF